VTFGMGPQCLDPAPSTRPQTFPSLTCNRICMYLASKFLSGLSFRLTHWQSRADHQADRGTDDRTVYTLH
jgi:hypothetical protein